MIERVITPEQAGIRSKRGEPLRKGTQRVLAHHNTSLMVAFNQHVKATRELQAAVNELLVRVAELEERP